MGGEGSGRKLSEQAMSDAEKRSITLTWTAQPISDPPRSARNLSLDGKW
jgi:hypothetical protein